MTDLEQIRANILANLNEITANPKPSYSIDGQSVSWESLFNSYVNQLSAIDQKINDEDPYEFHTIGVT